MPFVNQRADHDAHEEKKEDLKTADPGDGCGRFVGEEDGLIISLEDTIRLDAKLADIHIAHGEDLPGLVP